MVEAGPYIECYCKVYVLRSYVIQCVVVGLALVATTANGIKSGSVSAPSERSGTMMPRKMAPVN